MASTYPTSLDVFTNPLTTNPLTAPSHAQQHSDINDAVEALEAKVAIGATVLGTYTNYTPSYIDMTLGNGTVVAKYARVNNFVHAWGQLTFGTTTAITGGNVRISLPIPQGGSVGLGFAPLGEMIHYDVSALTRYVGKANLGSSGTMRCWVLNTQPAYTAITFITSTVPFTWATGDIMYWNLYYEAA